jgi:hypothetical protein
MDRIVRQISDISWTFPLQVEELKSACTSHSVATLLETYLVKQEGQFTYNVILRRVRETNIAVEKQ